MAATSGKSSLGVGFGIVVGIAVTFVCFIVIGLVIGWSDVSAKEAWSGTTASKFSSMSIDEQVEHGTKLLNTLRRERNFVFDSETAACYETFGDGFDLTGNETKCARARLGMSVYMTALLDEYEKANGIKLP